MGAIMNSAARYPSSPAPAAGRTRAETLVASGAWLLEAAPSVPQAVTEWFESGAAWLRPGQHFAAVDLAVDVVHAAAGGRSPVECAGPLAEALRGPVVHHPRGRGDEATYTALLPTTVHGSWRAPGAWVHPQSDMILVPAPGRYEPSEDGPWWVAPLAGPGVLCSPERLTAFVVLGRARAHGNGGRPDA
ncbi:hypothetical protein [Embleya sp. AB8]|uniref:hypothetical protein n=1 Tax=Embleya sp. AB8 TaxID=3156304 RepID=UPI003C711D57